MACPADLLIAVCAPSAYAHRTLVSQDNPHLDDEKRRLCIQKLDPD